MYHVPWYFLSRKIWSLTALFSSKVFSRINVHVLFYNIRMVRRLNLFDGIFFYTVYLKQSFRYWVFIKIVISSEKLDVNGCFLFVLKGWKLKWICREFVQLRLNGIKMKKKKNIYIYIYIYIYIFKKRLLSCKGNGFIRAFLLLLRLDCSRVTL